MDFQSFVQEVSSQIKEPTPIIDLPAMQASRQGSSQQDDTTSSPASTAPSVGLSKEALYEQSLHMLTEESSSNLQQAEHQVQDLEKDLEDLEAQMDGMGSQITALKQQILDLEDLYNKRKQSLFTARYLVEDAKKGYDTKAALLREAFGM